MTLFIMIGKKCIEQDISSANGNLDISLIFLLIGVMSVLHIQREWRAQYVRKQSLLNVIPIPVAEIKKPKAHEY